MRYEWYAVSDGILYKAYNFQIRICTNSDRKIEKVVLKNFSFSLMGVRNHLTAHLLPLVRSITTPLADFCGPSAGVAALGGRIDNWFHISPSDAEVDQMLLLSANFVFMISVTPCSDPTPSGSSACDSAKHCCRLGDHQRPCVSDSAYIGADRWPGATR